jgi:phage tail-like protein
MTDQLRVTLDGAPVTTVALDAPLVTIGRTPDNRLVLPHPLVSRRHAEIRLTDRGPLLTDLGSSNGTFVNGDRLLANQPRLLPNGAVFQIGPFVVTYEAEHPTPGPPLAGQPLPGWAEETSDGGEAVLSAFPAAEGGRGPDEGVSPVDGGREVEPRVGPSVADAPPAEPAPVEVAPPPLAPLAELRESAAPQVDRARADGHALAPLPRLPVPIPPGDTSRYLRDLPVIFHDNDFLGRFLKGFETIWEPREQRQDHIALYFDPRTAPAAFLPWLASWVDLPIDPDWPEERTRRLVADAMGLFRWRGTRYGLTEIIRASTGVTPEIVEDGPFMFRVRLRAPAGAVDRAMVASLIETHKPAHTGYVLDLQTGR